MTLWKIGRIIGSLGKGKELVKGMFVEMSFRDAERTNQ